MRVATQKRNVRDCTERYNIIRRRIRGWTPTHRSERAYRGTSGFGQCSGGGGGSTVYHPSHETATCGTSSKECVSARRRKGMNLHVNFPTSLMGIRQGARSRSRSQRTLPHVSSHRLGSTLLILIL